MYDVGTETGFQQAAAAVNAALGYHDASWAFFQMMTDDDRKAMDQMLVVCGHPLAYQAGNQWSRFCSLRRSGFRFS